MQFEFSLIIGLVLLVPNEAGRYLMEKPKFITPCQMSAPNFNKCFEKNLQPLFREWSNGIPGLKELGVLDPFHVERVKLSQQGNSAISLNAILSNIVITGLSKGIIKETKINRDTFDVNLKLLLPIQHFEFDFKAKGRVLSLPINGDGKAYFDADNVLLSLSIPTKLHTEGEHVFMDLQSIKLHIDNVEKFRVRTENLFGGQKDLEDAANTLFNENWRDLFEILQPAVEKIVEAVLFDRFKKIFDYIPFSYFVNDLPKS